MADRAQHAHLPLHRLAHLRAHAALGEVLGWRVRRAAAPPAPVMMRGWLRQGCRSTAARSMLGTCCLTARWQRVEGHANQRQKRRRLSLTAAESMDVGKLRWYWVAALQAGGEHGRVGNIQYTCPSTSCCIAWVNTFQACQSVASACALAGNILKRLPSAVGHTMNASKAAILWAQRLRQGAGEKCRLWGDVGTSWRSSCTCSSSSGSLNCFTATTHPVRRCLALTTVPYVPSPMTPRLS